MCLLLFAINPKPALIRTGYKLIVASNRDEFYSRPSLPAHTWEEKPQIYGGPGMDMEPGREGGAWLGMNTRTGSIAALLSIICKQDGDDKRGRGRIIPQFLHGDDEDGLAYLKQLEQDSAKYQPFSLLTFTNLGSSPVATYYSNTAPNSRINFHVKEDGTYATYGLGSSLFYTKPFKKATDGIEVLKGHLRSNPPTTDRQPELVDGLLSILKDTEPHFPDPQLSIQASEFDEGTVKTLSSMFVNPAMGLYGTRTHTIVLVTADNQVEFLEWTMEHPILDPYKPSWKHSSFSMSLNNPPSL